MKTHGIYATYNAGCRCSLCSEAHRVVRAERVEKHLADAEAGVPMRFEHGTLLGYQIGLCRCDECRAAAVDVDREVVARRRKDRADGVPLPDHVEHGRYAYTRWGCRCEDCRQGNREYQADYKARKAAGIVHPQDAVNRVERVRTTEN